MRSRIERNDKRKERKCAVRYPDYHDHIGVSDKWVEQRRQELRVELGTTGAKKKFPMQLHRMLDEVDVRDHSLVARWLPHGRAFVVLDKHRFEKELLPLYFPQQRQFASFLRQLGFYGFLRTEDGGYYHELLLRGRSNLVPILPRIAMGIHDTRRRYDPATAPDLYAMPWLPDIVLTLSGVGAPDPVHCASILPSSLMPRPEMKQSIPKNERKPPPTMPVSATHTVPRCMPAVDSNDRTSPVQTLHQVAMQPHGLMQTCYPGSYSDIRGIAAWLFPEDTSGESRPDPLLSSSHTHTTPNSSGRDFSETIKGSASLVISDWQRVDNAKLNLPQEPSHSRLLAAVPVLTLPSDSRPAEPNIREEYSPDPDRREEYSSFGMPNDDDSTSDMQDIESGLDDMETSSKSRKHTKLAEWVEFLEDVDLETSSDSGGAVTH